MAVAVMTGFVSRLRFGAQVMARPAPLGLNCIPMHMKQVLVTTRAEWRRWLARHHRKEKDGIGLVFFKDHTGQPSLPDTPQARAEEAVIKVRSAEL